MYPTSVK